MSLAAIGSASATFLLGSFGLAGTVLGAALAPVIVALVSELVRRPARTVTVRAGRSGRGRRRPGRARSTAASGAAVSPSITFARSAS